MTRIFLSLDSNKSSVRVNYYFYDCQTESTSYYVKLLIFLDQHVGVN